MERIKRYIKRQILRFFTSQGYEIEKIKTDEGSATFRGALKRLQKRNILFNTVIDIGASDGRWSEVSLEFFPIANYLLIEAQPCHKKELIKICKKYKNMEFSLSAAGEKKGSLYFNAKDPFGGQASTSPIEGEHIIIIPAITIDEEVSSRGLKIPYLMKFDIHGFELPILKGASNVLKDTNVIIMETYNFKIAPECLQFFEMCEYLKTYGFRCIDVYDLRYRPYDNAFWQMDLVFIKNDRPEFNYMSYV